MEMMFWNAVLTFLIGLVLWMAKVFWNELQRIQILVNKTREEVARENVTQQELDRILTHLDGRFDKLNDKLDAFIRESRSALK